MLYGDLISVLTKLNYIVFFVYNKNKPSKVADATATCRIRGVITPTATLHCAQTSRLLSRNVCL